MSLLSLISISYGLNPSHERFVSSAKRFALVVSKQLGRSLMYNRNKIGPRLEPWGTPHFISHLFPPGKLSRTISLNSHYMVIFRNPRDSLGISTLAKQMFPKHINYLMEAFDDATSKPYEYLMIDCHQLTPENMRLRTNILPGERQIVYARRT